MPTIMANSLRKKKIGGIGRIKIKKESIYKIAISAVYPLYLTKAEGKGRNKEEVDTLICWLTCYDKEGLQAQIDKEVDLETFLAQAPQINENADKIKGVICGIRVEEIKEPLMQKIRWLDKLIDELAKGKALEKILRNQY